jgi:hypothetical protein
MRKVFTLLLVWALLPLASYAQDPGCATPPATPAQIDFLLKKIKTLPVDEWAKNTGTTCIPIKIWAFRDDNGMGGVSYASLTEGLNYLNYYYLSAGIEFFYCSNPTYTDNSDYYDFDATAPDNDTESGMVALSGEVFDAVNIYVVNSIVTSSGFNAAGYAYLPYADNALYNRIVMDQDYFTFAPNGTYAHEFGHYFSLVHTHQGTENGNTHSNAEHVPRTGAQSNCSTHGDLLCDTEADPRYSSGDFDFSTCTYTGSATDTYGNVYSPPVDNIMSYYPDQCGGIFTAGQYTQIQQGLITRQGHTSYSLDCTAAAIPVPSGLTATINTNENGIDLSWTDNASTEMGYLIERSTTSSSTGFVPLLDGFTSPDVSSFVDNDITSNTTYWYRVKPSNGDCNSYSNVAGYTTGLLYCPAGSNTCDEYVARVQIGTIDNSTGCSPGGYARYLNLSTDTEMGITYTLTIDNGVYYTGDQYGVFVDWNQDGDFDDLDETVVTGTIGFSVTTSVTPPAHAKTGATRMRIRITYNQTADPCGIDSFGEVEDYSLNVTSPNLPVEWLSFEGELKNEGALLEWATASELNNEYFEVQRASDDFEFETIGRVEGAGTVFTASTYQWLDRDIRSGVYFYRIRQADLDGQYSFSDLIRLEVFRETALILAPNPARETLNLSYLLANPQEVTIRVFNASGRLQYERQLSMDKGVNQWQIPLDAMRTGMYFLQLIHQGQAVEQRFLKQ